MVLPHVSANSAFSEIISFDSTHDGKYVSVATDGYVRLWENSELKSSWTFPSVVEVQWSPSGNSFIGVSSETIFLWAEGQIKEFEGISRIKTVIWRNDTELTVSSAHGVWAWKLEFTYKNIVKSHCETVKWNSDCTILGLISSHKFGLYENSEIAWFKSGVTEFSFSPDKETVIMGKTSGKILFWDIASKSTFKNFTGHEQRIIQILHRNDGDFFLTYGLDGILHIWNEEKYEKIKSVDIGKIQDM